MVTVVPPVVGPEVGRDGGDGRDGDVGELVGRHGGAGAARRGHVDVVGPGRLGRGDGGDLGVGDHGEAGGRHVPKRTLVAPVKPVPVMVTVVPPPWSAPRSVRCAVTRRGRPA